MTPTRTIFKTSDGLGEWFYDLRYGLTHRTGHEWNWRSRWVYTLRDARCGLGLHWPIQLTRGYSYGYEPPEPHFECSTCGFERLPYRAVFWEGPLAYVYAAWFWLRHPVQQWRYRRDEKANPS